MLSTLALGPSPKFPRKGLRAPSKLWIVISNTVENSDTALRKYSRCATPCVCCKTYPWTSCSPLWVCRPTFAQPSIQESKRIAQARCRQHYVMLTLFSCGAAYFPRHPTCLFNLGDLCTVVCIPHRRRPCIWTDFIHVLTGCPGAQHLKYCGLHEV